MTFLTLSPQAGEAMRDSLSWIDLLVRGFRQEIA